MHGSRYTIESQGKSSHHSMTPPKSPLKPLPTAPNTSTRSSSQQHSQHSSSRSHSGQHDFKPQSQHTSSKPRRPSRDVEPPSPRLERAMSAKRVEPILRDTTPESSKHSKAAQSPMSITPQEPTSRDPRSESPTSVGTPTTITSQTTAKTAPPVEITRPLPPPEPTMPTKSTDPIIAAREIEAGPPIPVRSPSRKPSFTTFTERARFHLNRKKSPSKEVDGDDALSTNLPIQSPSGRDSPAKSPSSPLFKRLSTRRANALSMSTYSTSPTSTSKPSESPSSRNMTPVPQSESVASKPSHSSYNSISFLPLHPQLSPLPDYSTPLDAIAMQPSDQLRRSTSVNFVTALKRHFTGEPNLGVRRSSSVTSSVQNRRSSHMTSNPASRRSSVGNVVYPKRSSSINPPNSAPIPDDAGGSVNLQHPLLREARHAKFTTTTMPSTPARGSSRDLPLRHYHSQDNFRSIGYAARPREIILPKRTSSLLYNAPASASPSAHPILSSATLENENKLSPAPAQSSATPAPLHVGANPGTSAAIQNNAATTRSSPATVGSDDTEGSDGATPPPIGRGVRSPTPTMMRLDTKSKQSTRSSIKSPSSHKSPTSPSAKAPGVTSSPISPPAAEASQYKTSATNNIPFYLNPVSSAALIDFLASTPPASPPHTAASNTDPNAFDTQNLYKNYRVEEGESPAPPGPGGMPMLPLSLAQADPKNSRNTSTTPANKKAVWKRMFSTKGSGGGGSKNNPSKNTNIPKSEATKKNNKIKPPKQKKPKSSSKKPKRDEFEEMLNRGGLNLPDDQHHHHNDNNSSSMPNLQENGLLDVRDFGTSSALSVRKDDVDVDEISQVGSARTATTTKTGKSASAVNGASVNGETKGGGGGGQGFMGMGKDGMWISRKNFLRT